MAAEIVDSDVGALLLADFDATLRHIEAAMWSEIGAYVRAHVDLADRDPDDVQVITDRALALADAATTSFDGALAACCVGQAFDQATPQ